MADNESAASSGTATVKPEPSNPPETKRWADVAEEAEAEAEAEQEAEASSTDVKLDSLAIDESKQGHSTLTDPDDSSIEAVILSIYWIIVCSFLCIYCGSGFRFYCKIYILNDVL